MRAAFEREMLYAAEFPFMNYGIDLKEMARREKGVRIARFTDEFTDTDPAKKESEQNEINTFLSKQRSRKMDKIPIDFVGKGPRGYTLFDMVHHRGKSSPKLNQRYQDLVRYWGTEEQDSRISKWIQKRKKIGGFRYAMMGASYRRNTKQRGLKL